jgi:hypothetical protein
MGYNTEFVGEFKFKNGITKKALEKLKTLLGEDCRDHPEWTDMKAYTHIDYALTEKEDAIVWNEAEKSYDMVEKLNFIIREVKKVQNDFELEGSLFARGERFDDIWNMVINADGQAKAESAYHEMINPIFIYTAEEIEEFKLIIEDKKIKDIPLIEKILHTIIYLK